MLLVLFEPVDAVPILPHEACHELVGGSRRLNGAGAVVVDMLRPPTIDKLSEAVTNGQYHMLVFYGHGRHAENGGSLLFEDEFGGQNSVSVITQLIF